MAYEFKAPRTYSDIVKDFEKYKKEIFKGVWLVRYSYFSQFSIEQIKQFDRRITNDPIKSWKTIDWMVEMVKKREDFDILDGTHIKLVYEIVMKYLSCIQELSQNNYSMNRSVAFPIEDMVALDELSLKCFNMISHIYGQQEADRVQDIFDFEGYGPISKTQIGSGIEELVESRKTVHRPTYIDFIIERATK